MNSTNIRMEKANAIARYRSFQKITNLFRFVEICVFLVVISMFCSQFPLSVRVSADCFRGISFARFSPMFVFVVGNVIILILLFKYRVADNGDQYGVYDEYVKRCQSEKVNDGQIRRKLTREVTDCGGETPSPEICRPDSQSHRKVTEFVTGRKVLKNTPSLEICRSQFDGQSHRTVTESDTQKKILKNTPSPEICRSQFDGQSHRKVTESDTQKKMLKNAPSTEICRSQSNGQSHRKVKPAPDICRSQSEKVMRVECGDGESRRKLTRSVTEREISAPEICGVDELSSEAFRRTVEAFIARQQQSLRDEELAPVPYTCS